MELKKHTRWIVPACSGIVGRFENKMSAVTTNELLYVPKHDKSKGRIIRFNIKAHPNMYCINEARRPISNCRGRYITLKVILLKVLRGKRRQLSPPGHGISSIEQQSGTLFALTKDDVSLHSTRICPLTKGVTIFTGRGGSGERRKQGRWREGESL